MPKIKIGQKRKSKREELVERMRKNRKKSKEKKDSGSKTTVADLEERIEALEDALENAL